MAVYCAFWLWIYFIFLIKSIKRCCCCCSVKAQICPLLRFPYYGIHQDKIVNLYFIMEILGIPRMTNMASSVTFLWHEQELLSKATYLFSSSSCILVLFIIYSKQYNALPNMHSNTLRTTPKISSPIGKLRQFFFFFLFNLLYVWS